MKQSCIAGSVDFHKHLHQSSFSGKTNFVIPDLRMRVAVSSQAMFVPEYLGVELPFICVEQRVEFCA